MPELIINVMGLKLTAALQPQLNGKDNEMLSVFASLADVHARLENRMVNKGHQEFRKEDKQYKIPIPEWKLFTTSLLSFTLLGLSSSLKKYNEQHKHDIVDSVIIVDANAQNDSRTQVSNGGKIYSCYVTKDDKGQHYYIIGDNDEQFTFEKNPDHSNITHINSKYRISAQSDHLTTPDVKGDIYTPLTDFITVRDIPDSEKKLVINNRSRQTAHDVSSDGNKLTLTHVEKDHVDYRFITSAAQMLTFLTGLIGLAFSIKDRKTVTYNKKKPESSFEHLNKELERRGDKLSNHLNERV